MKLEWAFAGLLIWLTSFDTCLASYARLRPSPFSSAIPCTRAPRVQRRDLSDDHRLLPAGGIVTSGHLGYRTEQPADRRGPTW